MKSADVIFESKTKETRGSDTFHRSVYVAIDHFLNNHLQRPHISWSDHQPHDLYRGACHIIMRLVVILFIEARDLFPQSHLKVGSVYVGLQHLRDQLERTEIEQRKTEHHAWPLIVEIFKILDHDALTDTAHLRGVETRNHD